ncbi:tetratricopeptide repeat protein [Actinoplanes sp. M2I2]|uniref:tetratricopeptide repeat protein n=1 Tax=Actinoplanes sp. M2I2 TaxID=1734444 RepID=UPI00202274BB|nr:tetratricopeptide repeat protein [Actinoplanes sp. M2I2]
MTSIDPPRPEVPRQRKPTAVPGDLPAALEALGDRNPAAAQLLCLCSVLHRAPVPVDVFTRSLDRMPLPLGGVAQLQFNGLVAALVQSGLAQRAAGGLRVPEPVREAVRDDLGDEAAGICRTYAGVLIAAAAPDDVAEPSGWPRWAALAPHLIAADAAHSTDPALRAAACRLVVSLLHRGKARPARTIAAELHTGWRGLLGPDHPDTLRCAHELARSLVAAGALLPARKLLDDTVDRLVAALGQSHPQTRIAAETRRGVLLRMGGMPRPDGSRPKAAHRRRKQP